MSGVGSTDDRIREERNPAMMIMTGVRMTTFRVESRATVRSPAPMIRTVMHSAATLTAALTRHQPCHTDR